jgi:hypothetical protein
MQYLIVFPVTLALAAYLLREIDRTTIPHKYSFDDEGHPADMWQYVLTDEEIAYRIDVAVNSGFGRLYVLMHKIARFRGLAHEDTADALDEACRRYGIETSWRVRELPK